MTQATFRTSAPRAFAQFFSEVNYEDFLKVQREYEKSHGDPGESVDVLFFQEIPGKCPEQLKTDTRFAGIKDFQFSDQAVSKNYVQRQLLITVVL